MATVVKELIARFSSDTKELESGSAKAEQVIGTFAKGAAAAVGVAAAAFGVLAVKQAKVGDELGKISQKYGMAVDALSGLDHAAGLAGISTVELANSFKFLNNSLVDASSGSETAAKAYEILGLKASELISLKPEESFLRIGEALSKIENPALRSALAIDIFGRSGADILPLFKSGAEGIKAALSEAERFGLVINQVDSTALENANDAVAKIGSAANGAARQFAAGLAPAITATTENLLRGVDVADKFRSLGSFMADTWTQGMEAISRILTATGIVFDELKLKILETTKAGREFFGLDTSELQNNMAGLSAQINRDQTNLDLRIAKKGGGFKQGIRGEFEGIISGQTAERKSGGAKTAIDSNSLKLLDSLKDKTAGAESAVKKLGETSKNTTAAIDAGFLASAKMVDGFKSSALNSVNQIGSAIGQLIGGGGGGIRGALGGIAGDLIGGGLSSVISGSFLGGAGFDIFKGIKWNADGGVISGRSVFPSSQGMQGAGEAGAEAILPLTRVGGKLGVRSEGGGGRVTQNITINAGVSQTVRAEMMRLLPQIKQEAVRAVSEGQARGQTP